MRIRKGDEFLSLKLKVKIIYVHVTCYMTTWLMFNIIFIKQFFSHLQRGYNNVNDVSMVTFKSSSSDKLVLIFTQDLSYS